MNDNNDTDLIVRKRIINHRNKQIETRIKRHVIIENGQMILDSGPQVTTKTIEDTRQESEEYDKNGQQTYQTSNDDNDQINKNDGNDDGNKVVNDTNKCHKSNSNKTYLFGEDMIKKKTTNRLNIPKYYYGSNPSKNSKTEHSTMKMNNLLMKSNSNDNKIVIDEQDCQYSYETDRFSRIKYGNKDETNHHPEYNKRTQLWSL